MSSGIKNVEISRESLNWLIHLHKTSQVLLEGNILKHISTRNLSKEQQDYIALAITKDKDKRRKRLSITKDVQHANKKLESAQFELEEALTESNLLRKQAEEAKNEAVDKLDDYLKKTQANLMNTVVTTMVYFLIGINIATVGLYLYSSWASGEGTADEIIKNLVSQVIISSLTSAFGIVGTLFGLKQQSEKSED